MDNNSMVPSVHLCKSQTVIMPSITLCKTWHDDEQWWECTRPQWYNERVNWLRTYCCPPSPPPPHFPNHNGPYGGFINWRNRRVYRHPWDFFGLSFSIPQRQRWVLCAEYMVASTWVPASNNNLGLTYRLNFTDMILDTPQNKAYFNSSLRL